jgi:galactonate dehydratase
MICRKDLEFSAGEIIVLTKPGLGVELDEEACKRRPHKTHHVPFFDGRLNVEAHGDYRPFVRPAQ